MTIVKEQMIIYADGQLEFPDLLRLLNGEIAAIRVRKYYDPAMCEEIAQRILDSDLHGAYAYAPNTSRAGWAFYETLASPQHREIYDANALQWIQQLRKVCTPFLSPIDQFRLTLDEVWPHGATIATLDGKRMFVGSARVFHEGSVAEPHQDHLNWYAPGVSEAESLMGQIACNVYLTMPDTGGQLIIWPKTFNRDEYLAARKPDSYGIADSALMNCMPLSITPEVGELVLFNSNFCHAVTAPFGRKRVTWSCFMGYYGPNDRLVVWS